MYEQLAAAGGKLAARAAMGAASPYVMVKHGRREDRAAAYDRFVAACAVLFCQTDLDDGQATELVTSYLAVEMRAPVEVQVAAAVLFRRIVGFNGMIGGTSRKGWWRIPDQDFIPVPDDAWYESLEQDEGVDGETSPESCESSSEPLNGDLPGKPFGDSDELLHALECFTAIARRDVRARWWHPVVMPWRSSWWPRRKGRRGR
ncbi:hypothetical protein AB0D90_31300 [Streptomyces althioticus]|uniref:hypothetical protein n=1 Tax=Streptomyces althioticus TaxID=83380 RepID=UPI0033C383B0